MGSYSQIFLVHRQSYQVLQSFEGTFSLLLLFVVVTFLLCLFSLFFCASLTPFITARSHSNINQIRGIPALSKMWCVCDQPEIISWEIDGSPRTTKTAIGCDPFHSSKVFTILPFFVPNESPEPKIGAERMFKVNKNKTKKDLVIATAGFDGSLLLSDASDVCVGYVKDAHSDTIRCLESVGLSSLLTGGRDGYLRIWDIL